MARNHKDTDLRRRDRERNENEYEEFRETLAAPAPTRYHETNARMPTYRSEQSYYDIASPAERWVRGVALILGAALGVRFVVALFTSDTTNAVVSAVFQLTNWLTQPFEAMFSTSATAGSGYVDVPALAAIATIGILAWLINTLIRSIRGRTL